MKSSFRAVLGPLVVLLSGVYTMAAEPPTPPVKAAAVEANIPFANHGGIYTWQVENDRSVLIQSQSRKWYRATLFSPCFDLPFSETLGFETEASGSFDKFSSIRMRGQTCRLTSLVETAAPLKKQKKPVKPAQPAKSDPAPA